jgi:hypothetical protein
MQGNLVSHKAFPRGSQYVDNLGTALDSTFHLGFLAFFG